MDYAVHKNSVSSIKHSTTPTLVLRRFINSISKPAFESILKTCFALLYYFCKTARSHCRFSTELPSRSASGPLAPAPLAFACLRLLGFGLLDSFAFGFLGSLAFGLVRSFISGFLPLLAFGRFFLLALARLQPLSLVLLNFLCLELGLLDFLCLALGLLGFLCLALDLFAF